MLGHSGKMAEQSPLLSPVEVIGTGVSPRGTPPVREGGDAYAVESMWRGLPRCLHSQGWLRPDPVLPPRASPIGGAVVDARDRDAPAPQARPLRQPFLDL